MAVTTGLSRVVRPIADAQAQARAQTRARPRLGISRRKALGLLGCLGATPLLDRTLGWCARRIADFPPREGWLYPPGARTTINYMEYSHEIVISDQGLRGPDLAPEGKKPPGTYRIAVIGDSLTFGWGVDVERVWTTLLNGIWNAKGASCAVEVVNVGLLGADPWGYSRLCQDVLPALEADCVLVGITQGEDLVQLSGRRLGDVCGTMRTRGQTALNRAFGWVYPASHSWMNRRPERMAVRATSGTETESESEQRRVRGILDPAVRWSASMLWERWDAATRERFLSLETEIREAFHAGRLNPLLLEVGCRFPEKYRLCLDTDGPLWPLSLDNLNRALTAIGQSCADQFLPWMVVEIPNGVHVSPSVIAGRRRLGFDLTEELLDRPETTAAVAALCARHGIPFLPTADAFRANPDGTFFPIDGHLTARGNALLAEIVAQALPNPVLQG